jgi:AcrR family transcriptional regulator
MASPPRAPALPPEDPRRAATRARVIDEATRLFSLYGFRRTSVDTIASAAAVAKPTLYTYFPDKDALFLAVCEHVLESILAAARAAAKVDGPLEARLSGVLAAKFTHLFELVDASPHAAELLGSSDRVAAERVEEADRRFAAILKELLSGAVEAGEIDPGRAGSSVPKLVEVLLRCGHGAGYRAGDGARHRKQLEEMVRIVVAAVRIGKRS